MAPILDDSSPRSRWLRDTLTRSVMQSVIGSLTPCSPRTTQQSRNRGTRHDRAGAHRRGSHQHRIDGHPGDRARHHSRHRLRLLGPKGTSDSRRQPPGTAANLQPLTFQPTSAAPWKRPRRPAPVAPLPARHDLSHHQRRPDHLGVRQQTDRCLGAAGRGRRLHRHAAGADHTRRPAHRPAPAAGSFIPMQSPNPTYRARPPPRPARHRQPGRTTG